MLINKFIQKNQFKFSKSLIIGWFIAVLIAWILAAVVDSFIPPAQNAGIYRSPIEVLSVWDGEHYTIIASNGYSIEGADIRHFAFFPLVPKVAGLVGGTYAPFAGILLGQLCFLGCLILLNNLVPIDEKLPLRIQPGFWLLISPLSFFFLIFYTESIFLFLTLLMITVCRKERFIAASVLGVLVGLTRPVAILLPIIFIWWSIQNFRRGKGYFALLICAVAPLLGVGLYLGFVGYLVGEPLAYIQIQKQWWESHWAFPFLSLARDFKGLLTGLMQGQSYPVDIYVRLLSSISIFFIIVWGWRKCEPAFLVYLIASLLFIHSQEPHRSTARYELVLFPLYLILPKILIHHPKVTRIIIGIFVVAQVLLFVRHISWKWVS